jgi:hypothetical protein
VRPTTGELQAALLWLRRSDESKSPSAAQEHARVLLADRRRLLGEVERYREALERIQDEFGRADHPDAYDAAMKFDPVVQIAAAALEDSPPARESV